MNRIIEQWSVHKILKLLWDKKLNYKPNIQRQFIYNPTQQQQVIQSIKKGFVASSLVIEEESPGSYVLLDGKQRINSIIGFINKAISVDDFYFNDSYRLDKIDKDNRYSAPNVIAENELKNSDNSDSAKLLRFEFPVVLYSDMSSNERLTLFNVINTTGEKLNTWELINGRYPSKMLFDMRSRYFNEILRTNTTSLSTNNPRVLMFEKYFGTHEVNRGELYYKILEKLFVMYGGDLDDKPYEIIDGIVINQRNYNKLCKFVESHNSEKFEEFAKPLIDKLNVFYDMFKDVNNLGALKECCFNISDSKIYNENIKKFNTNEIKSNLGFLITQFNYSDLKNAFKDKELNNYFENNILPLALVMPNQFREKLDTKRFYDKKDKERIFYSSKSFNKDSLQVKCEGTLNDNKTPCGCGKYITLDEATVDHIQPWILGGKTNDENAQLLCRECNSKKGAKIISELLKKK